MQKTANSIRQPLREDLIWGVRAIAIEIGRTERQVTHLLENNYIPARKVGGRWCASRTALAAALCPQ